MLSGKIFCADSCTRANAHVLKYTLVDHSERGSVSGAEQEDKATVGPRFHAILLLGPIALLIMRPVNDVRLHANGENPDGLASAFHSPPSKIAVWPFAWNIDVDTTPSDGISVRKTEECLLLRFDAR